MEDRHLSLSEVAGLMSVSERTVRRWIKSGKLKAYRPGRDYRIPESAFRAFVEESEVYPKALAPPSLFNDLEERGYRPPDSEIKALDRWLSYLEQQLDERNLSRDEIAHELDAALAAGIRKAPAEYPDEIYRKFMRLMRRALEEGKSFDALQDAAAALEADMNRMEEARRAG